MCVFSLHLLTGYITCMMCALTFCGPWSLSFLSAQGLPHIPGLVDCAFTTSHLWSKTEVGKQRVLQPSIVSILCLLNNSLQYCNYLHTCYWMLLAHTCPILLSRWRCQNPWRMLVAPICAFLLLVAIVVAVVLAVAHNSGGLRNVHCGIM